MKRIMNNVAVATLLYTIPGDKIVKIIDTPHYLYCPSDPWENYSGDLIKEFTVNEILHKVENETIAKATIWHTAVNDGKLLLVIDTVNERY